MRLITSLSDPRPAAITDTLTADQVRVVHACASWLISYPDEQVLRRLATIDASLTPLPEPVRGLLGATLGALRGLDPLTAASAYVETFDTRRRGCLYLTYFSHGETRRRGMALVRIKDAYRAAGLDLGDAELPDHLAVVLEFAAGHDLARGVKILQANRPGLELLRLHLAETESPWHGAVAAVCATLPALQDTDRDAMLLLAAEGPADEEVGLDPYDSPGISGAYR